MSEDTVTYPIVFYAYLGAAMCTDCTRAYSENTGTLM